MSQTGFVRVFFAGWQGRFVAVMLVFFALMGLGWSGFFISVKSIDIRPTGTVLVRTVPFGTVNAEWVMEITSGEGHECQTAMGISIIQPMPNDTARLPLPAAVQPCAAPGAVAEVSYTVRFFGIPLRPVRRTVIVGVAP